MLNSLQWVHGLMTVVMEKPMHDSRGALLASMGPRPDDRGYGRNELRAVLSEMASMGPRPDDRGYESW